MNNGLKTKIRTFNVNLKSTKYLGKNLIAYKLSYFVGHSLPKTREIQGVPKKHGDSVTNSISSLL